MDRDAWNLEPDSVQRALDAFLPRSGGQVMREAFYGVTRFDDFLRHTGLTRAVLSSRLKELVEQDMLRRVEYRDAGARRRDEYHLTDKSLDLLPVLVALMGWADTWLGGRRGPTAVIRHRECGAAVTLDLRCADGHPIVTALETSAEPGPGAKRRRPVR